VIRFEDELKSLGKKLMMLLITVWKDLKRKIKMETLKLEWTLIK
jgi:hypothetical protein